MATFAFETISAAQALNWLAADELTAVGRAFETTVIYNTDGTFSVTIGNRTVIFGANFSNGATPTNLTYPDGSKLWIGRTASESITVTNFTGGGAAYGGPGADTIEGALGGFLVQGNQGDDQVFFASGSHVIYGGQDNDAIFVGGSLIAGTRNFMQGNRGDDTLTGSVNLDTLLGGQGNDVLQSTGGLDFMNGNLGDDVISGAGTLLGEGGADTITASLPDVLSTVSGGDGDDRLTGTSPTGPGQRAAGVIFNGDGGDDSLIGTTGGDTLNGGDGGDFIISVPGNIATGDRLDGGAGDDTLLARDGTNFLQGGDGNDKITGGEGADTIDGGAGADVMIGDTEPVSGVDVFVIDDAPQSLAFVQGLDKILDWQATDRIRLAFTLGAGAYSETTAADFSGAVTAARGAFAGGTTEAVAIQVGADVMLFVDGGAANAISSAVILTGRSLNDISVGNFT